MKYPLIMFAAAIPLSGVGCVGNDSSIHLLSAFPLQTTAPTTGGCQAATVSILAGSLDISATTHYVLDFAMESTFQQFSSSLPAESAFQGPQRNDFVGQQLAFSYTTTPDLGLADELILIYMRLPAGASGTNSFIFFDLITPNVASRLLNSVRPGDTLTLQITIQVRGELASGQKVNSNKATFPIHVYNSGFLGCRAGDKRVPNGPCGLAGGQDGTQVGCCKDFPTPPIGC